MKKLEAIKQVQECMSSVFSKDDVIALINKIEGELTTVMCDYIVREIKTQIRKLNEDDIVNYDDAEFELDYNNKINLTSISINLDKIEEIIEEVIEDYVPELIVDIPKSEFFPLKEGDWYIDDSIKESK